MILDFSKKNAEISQNMLMPQTPLFKEKKIVLIFKCNLTNFKELKRKKKNQKKKPFK